MVVIKTINPKGLTDMSKHHKKRKREGGETNYDKQNANGDIKCTLWNK